MARLGQRFVLYRPSERSDQDEKSSVRQAVGNRKDVEAMRRDLRRAALGLFAGCSAEGVREATEHEVEWLIQVCWLVARARAGVHTAYNGDILDAIKPELPTRLAMSLAQLMAGMDAIGVSHDEVLQAIANVAFGCIPASRLAALRFLYGHEAPQTTKAVGTALSQSTESARRTLQELAVHKLAQRTSAELGKADRWSLTAPARAAFRLACTRSTQGLGFSTDGSEPWVGNPTDGVGGVHASNSRNGAEAATAEEEGLAERLFEAFGDETAP
jgi:hypothetical protein